MPIKARPETLAQLTSMDKAALKAMYQYRCINESLLQKYFYQKHDDGKNNFTRNRIKWFIHEELLEVDEYGEGECAFYLTNRGLQTVRALIETPLYTIDSKTGRRVYDITSASIRTPIKLLNHQMLLNELALNIESRCDLPLFCYKDNKFASNFRYAQPDGVFELPDFDIFLEMDTSSERLVALKRKWEHYRNYFSSREYYLHRNKKIIVLFATENIKRNFEQRRSTVIKSLSNTIFDLFGENFECYIGPSSSVAKTAEHIIKRKPLDNFRKVGYFLQSQMGFVFSTPAAVRDACNETYLLMCRRDDFGKPRIIDGRVQMYFLENYLHRPISVLSRILHYPRTETLLSPVFRNVVPMIVLVPDEDSIFRDLQSSNGFGVPNVFFVTESRLRELPLPEALFQFDQLGNKYHFTDLSFANQVIEG